MTHGLTLDGFDCCVYCWQVFGGEGRGVHPGIGMGINHTFGPVVHAESGTEYERVGTSDGGTPLAHPDCYKEWKSAVRPTEETALTDFEQ